MIFLDEPCDNEYISFVLPDHTRASENRCPQGYTLSSWVILRPTSRGKKMLLKEWFPECCPQLIQGYKNICVCITINNGLPLHMMYLNNSLGHDDFIQCHKIFTLGILMQPTSSVFRVWILLPLVLLMTWCLANQRWRIINKTCTCNEWHFSYYT